MQKDHTIRMLGRRGLSTEVIDKGNAGVIEYARTRDALMTFIRDGKVTIDAMKTILGLMTDSQELVILVHANAATSDAKQALAKMAKIHAFTFDEMAFDLIEVVPTHSLVGKPKPKEWTKYPTILSTDVVARYYAFKRGDVIRVEEDDGTISYKKCV